MSDGAKLRPVKEPGLRLVHLLGPGSAVVALCGTEPIQAWRSTVPSEHVCNACHAEACKLRGVIAWQEPKS